MVVKIGSILLADDATGEIRNGWLDALCSDLAVLRKRGADVMSDADQILTLLNSEKDESELTMCTDVDRNDKSRVCEAGSVHVIGRRQIEMYSRLIHTVDHVEGTLREGFDALDGFLARCGSDRTALSGYVCHPGGEKVVSAFEEVLGLELGGLAHARAVLRDHGNMSAASVLFVLERVLAETPHGRHLMTSLGPGFTAAFALMDLP